MITEPSPTLDLHIPEGYPEPAVEVVAMAAELLRSIEGVAVRRQVCWVAPVLSSDEEGAIDLYFQSEENWLCLTVEPGKKDWVVLTMQRVGQEPRFTLRSLAEAADEVASLLPPVVEVKGG